MKRRELVQVTNVNYAGVTMYAWKPVGSIDPLPAEILWDPDPAFIAGPLYEIYLMNESYTGTRGSVGKGRWAQCHICTEDFPISQMTESNGKYYCTKNKCNEDLL